MPFPADRFILAPDGRQYRVAHCGHPTALWPYAIYDPDGRLIAGPNGRAFRLLKEAVAAAQLVATGQLGVYLHGHYCVGEGPSQRQVDAAWAAIRRALKG